MRPLIGAWGGAVLAIVGCIAYDTSANVATLDGGHTHLKFGAIILIGAIGAFLGFVLGILSWAAQIRRQSAQMMRDQAQAQESTN